MASTEIGCTSKGPILNIQTPRFSKSLHGTVCLEADPLISLHMIGYVGPMLCVGLLVPTL
jgi:hypothetical protein